MSERYDDTTTPNLGSNDYDSTQGQGQGQFDRDSTTRDSHYTGPDIRSEGRDPTQGQGQHDDDPITRSSNFGDRSGRDLSQVTSQSADPDYGRNDSSRGQAYEQESRRGGLTDSDRVPLQDDQERFEPSGNYGISSGTVPDRRPDDDEIRGDGGFSGKPSLSERVKGTTEKVVGKATGNTRMYERGEERKAGGY